MAENRGSPARDEAIRATIAAWVNPGRHEPRHDKARETLRKQWPALAKSLDRLVDIEAMGNTTQQPRTWISKW